MREELIMSAAAAIKLLGTQARFETSEGMEVYVVVKDVKQAWGKTRFFVEPVAGLTAIWVERLYTMDGERITTA
jgi:hypothetical protein